MIMKFIKEKIEEGVLDLSKVPTFKLIEWCQDASREDQDALGHEIIYR